MKLVVNGRSTRVRVEGADASPPVLLLHGLGRSLEDWGPQFSRLAGEYRVIALDMPGFGFSQRAGAPTTLSVLAHCVVETLDALGEERPVHVIGNSLGGAVAQQILALRPERVASLTLVSSLGFGSEVPIPMRLLAVPVLGQLMTLRTTRMSAKIAERMIFADPALATSERIDHAVALSREPDTGAVTCEAARAVASLRGVKPGWRERLASAVSRHPRPTLIVWGERDQILPVRHLDAARRVYPEAQTHTLAGVGHVAQIERPDEFAALVRNFLADADTETVAADNNGAGARPRRTPRAAPPTDPPSVCVIGAGISGLTSGKMLSDYGIPYVCFESGDRIGGNWAFKNPNGHSSAYASLHIDTSKERLRFRDFAISDDFPDYPHHSQIKQYLDGYADTFDLRDRLRFETPVARCERLPGGGWNVETDDGEEHRFDVLVVGNGHHWDPRYPEFPGSFDGPTIHSHHYIDPTDPLPLRGKRVLVVGIGNSAVDIASELALKSNAERVFISTRSGAWVVPKYVFGRPIDRVTGTIPWLPLAPQRRLAQLLPTIVSGRMENYGLPRPNHKFLETHPTLSSELLVRLGSGDVVAKPNVERLEHDRVRFVDGTAEDVDAIIYATGYNITFPFFDPDFISAPQNKIRLYKRMFKPGIDDLVFVGFGQALPTLFPFIELQAQLMARYVAGTYRLPSQDEMERVIDADHRRHVGHFQNVARNTQEVDYPVYEYDIRTREIPAGRARVATLGAVPLTGRVATPSAAAR